MKDNKAKRAFFFLRHNNDIDHIVPVLYKWLSTQNIQTDVIITTKKEFLKDDRIVFLKQFENARIFHINDLVKKYSLSYFLNIYYSRYGSSNPFFKKKAFLQIIADIADRNIEKIADELFSNVENGIVVFDWTATYFTQEVIKNAKKKGFTTISLPHGDEPYFNIIQTNNYLDYSALEPYKTEAVFDYVVVPNSLCLRRYTKHMQKSRIKVLGSPRYSNEWMKILSEFIPIYHLKESKNKLKIVFFLRNAGWPIFWDEVSRTVKLIMQFDGVYLIVKHHPRNKNARNLTKQLINKYPEIKKHLDSDLKFIYEGVNSGSLLKWADIVLDVGTSVTWDAIKQKKIVLMMEYLHVNISTVAHYIPETEMKCRDDLYDTIKSLTKSKKDYQISKKNREKFLNEIIDTPDEKVLERYCIFLKDCFNKSEDGV